jgi:NTP pyrophosphatase (non-canonical NTP hydrolase)
MSTPEQGDDLTGVHRLLGVMRALRDPATGCAWDRAQDSRSLARYTLEEACEVIAAIEAGDDAALRDELGDLLFQVVFHSISMPLRMPLPASSSDAIRMFSAKLRRARPVTGRG